MKSLDSCLDQVRKTRQYVKNISKGEIHGIEQVLNDLDQIEASLKGLEKERNAETRRRRFRTASLWIAHLIKEYFSD